jgi:hypothetical protein
MWGIPSRRGFKPAADFPAGPIDLARIRYYELACQRLRVRVGQAGKYTRRGPCSLTRSGRTGIRGFRGLPVGAHWQATKCGCQLRAPSLSGSPRLPARAPSDLQCHATVTGPQWGGNLKSDSAERPERGPPREDAIVTVIIAWA